MSEDSKLSFQTFFTSININESSKNSETSADKTKESKTFKIIKSLFQIKVSKSVQLRLVFENIIIKQARSKFNKSAMTFNKIELLMFKQITVKKLNLLDLNLK